MNWTDEQRAAMEKLVARDGCCTVSTDDVSGLTERIGWNSPEPIPSGRVYKTPYEWAMIECGELRRHLAAVLDGNMVHGCGGYCDWCNQLHEHVDDCPWALAKAYLDSLNGE